MRLRIVLGTALLAAVLVGSACTSSKTSVPSLTGPSTFGLGMSVQASPDVLAQNGTAQSKVTIQTRDQNGVPKGGVSVYVAIQVGGVPTDFGSLSARNLTTDSNGQATVTYTAPPKPPFSVDTETVVSIVFTPLGDDYANATPHTVNIRVRPVGVIIPPVDFTAAFTFTPAQPTVFESVLFDASASTDPSGAITSYSWDFGDGEQKTGKTVTHEFTAANTYAVRLTVSDDHGRSVSTTQQVTVGESAPTADFVFSPTDPTAGDTVSVNAASSTAGSGRTIETYTWDFGDPHDTTAGSGQSASHLYSVAGTYTITLTVTDDAGQSSTASQAVTVKP